MINSDNVRFGCWVPKVSRKIEAYDNLVHHGIIHTVKKCRYIMLNKIGPKTQRFNPLEFKLHDIRALQRGTK